VELWSARSKGEAVDQAKLDDRLRSAISEVVKKQVDSGIDVPNEGEYKPGGWGGYYTARMDGWEPVPANARRDPAGFFANIRERKETPEWLDLLRKAGSPPYSFLLPYQDPPLPAGGGLRPVNTGPLKYSGQAELRKEIEALKAAAAEQGVVDTFMSAIGAPFIERFYQSTYYKTTEEFCWALADALHEEYKMIADAGIILQLDDPELCEAWNITFPDITLADYRKWLELRVEIINHAIRDIPREMVRLHVCWGSWHTPHAADIPLKDILDILLKVNAQAVSVEASNPRHDHEWEAWKDVKLPDDLIVVPGVIGHYSDYIEHPGLIAERIVKYASVVGRENVIAGVDCGLGTRVGHDTIVWKKFEAMAEGARIATARLWS
jgi:5-methyltetrahydropteroyltriglutamate--homocysteine methyltransferase